MTTKDAEAQLEASIAKSYELRDLPFISSVSRSYYDGYIDGLQLALRVIRKEDG